MAVERRLVPERDFDVGASLWHSGVIAPMVSVLGSVVDVLVVVEPGTVVLVVLVELDVVVVVPGTVVLLVVLVVGGAVVDVVVDVVDVVDVDVVDVDVVEVDVVVTGVHPSGWLAVAWVPPVKPSDHVALVANVTDDTPVERTGELNVCERPARATSWCWSPAA